MQQIQIPPDFPRTKTHGAIGGAMPKVLLKEHDGKYFVGQTDDEHYQRYDICADMVVQLLAYCQRKSLENPDWTIDFNLARTERGFRDKVSSGQWNFSEQEIRWIMDRCAAGFSNSNAGMR
jgi:hypothetical protein